MMDKTKKGQAERLQTKLDKRLYKPDSFISPLPLCPKLDNDLLLSLSSQSTWSASILLELI